MEAQEAAFQELIQTNLTRLVSSTVLTSAVLIDLYAAGVIDEDEKETIEAERTDYAKKFKLWTILKQRCSKLRELIHVFERRSQPIPLGILRTFSLGSSDSVEATAQPTSSHATPSGISAQRRLQISANGNGDPIATTPRLLDVKIPDTSSQADSRSFVPKLLSSCVTTPDSKGFQTLEYIMKHYKPTKYESKGKYKGLALIMNIITFDDEPDAFRAGADKDTQRLKEVLENLNYLVCLLTDPTAEMMSNAIEEFQQYFDEYDVDSCIVSIMSHGQNNDRIYTKNGTLCNLWNDVVAKFSNAKVKSRKLIGMPKIFLFNYCRGREIDRGTIQHDALPFNQSPGLLPSWTDMVVCYSTLQDHYSYRSTGRNGLYGSWFIQSFCDVVERYAGEYHLMQLLDIVSHVMKLAVGENLEKQICPYYNIGFDKEFYFTS